jgi:hypothetical protein
MPCTLNELLFVGTTGVPANTAGRNEVQEDISWMQRARRVQDTVLHENSRKQVPRHIFEAKMADVSAGLKRCTRKS